MASYQYRIHTDSNGTSNYGYAYFALFNPSDSGRKVTLRSLEVAPQAVVRGATVSFLPATLYRGASILSGEDMAASRVVNDSSTSLSSTVKLRRNAVINTYANSLHHLDLGRRGGAVSLQNRLLLGSQMTLGARRLSGCYNSQIRGGTALEPITVNGGEALALVVDATVNTISNPQRVNVVLSVGGKTAVWDFVANPRPGEALFSVESTSSTVVKLLSYGVMDVGTTDTPTLRVVPIGQLYAPDVGDTSKQGVTAVPMNSDYPALSTFGIKLFSDIGLIPSGVPEIAIAQASTGTPAGMNYLHTRDFWGPMYRNMLVETSHVNGTALPDAFGFSYGHRRTDLLVRRAGIVINPGEGIAIVNSAETAVGVQAAYGGWTPLSFAAHIDVAPAVVPTIGATGMVAGSRYRVERASNGSLVTDGVADGTGAFSYVYPVEDTPLNMVLKVRKASSAPYYKPYQVTFNLTSAGITVPVSQVADA